MGARIRRVLQGPLAFILTFVLAWGLVPAPGIAWALDAPYAVSGTYTFRGTLEDSPRTSTFTYRDDCFCRSSFLGCTHLTELSMKVANTSGFQDTVLPMLQAMGFSDVEANAYLAQGIALDDSMGVAVGRRTITDAMGTHTLLVVAPRSAAYANEWASNMTVGDAGIHEGFKEGRDEVLRFLKGYVSRHNVSGDIKLWLCGHSRGAAVASLVAGFFAEGGTPYLGRSVTIAPENIYCYGIATPTNVRPSATLAEALSVSGSRGGAYADLDSKGEPFVSHATGTVNLHGRNTGGIFNFVRPDDIVSKLPPSTWDYARYGSDHVISQGEVSVEEMLAELAQYSPAAYDQYVASDPRDFSWKTLDVAEIDLDNISLETLPFVDADKDYGVPTFSAYGQRLVDGITMVCPTSATYSESAQDSLRAALALITGGALSKATAAGVKLDNIAKAFLYSHVTYAGTRLGNTSDAETLGALVAQLTEAYTDINATTVDDLLRAVGKFVDKYEHSPLVSSVAERVVSLITEKYPNVQPILQMLLMNLYPVEQVQLMTLGNDSASLLAAPSTLGTGAPSAAVDFEALDERERQALGALAAALVQVGVGEGAPTEDVVPALMAQDESVTSAPSMKDLIINFLKVMYTGVQEGAGAYDPEVTYEESAQNTRNYLYFALILAGDGLGIPSEVVNAIVNTQGQVPLVTLLEALMPMICGGAESMSKAAEVSFAQAAAKMAEAVPDAEPYLDELVAHTSEFLGLLNSVLFSGNGGPYDLMYTVNMLSTLVKHAACFGLVHYVEPSVCWATVLNRKDPTIHGYAPGGGGTTPGSSQARYTYSGYSSYAGTSYTTTGTTTGTTTARARRLAGADRYQTMRAIVSAGFTSSECAVLAVGTSYPDALAASALAGALGAPVVLTDGAALSDAAREELERLGVRRVCVAGGEAAVSEGVIEALRALGLEVERVAGADRADTSVEMMRAVREAGSTSDTVVVVSGTGFADALSIGPWAYATKSPVLLAGEDGLLGEAALDAIRSDPLVRRVIVVGGEAAVGDVEGQLRGEYEVLRLAGADRFETSARVAAWASAHGLGWHNPVVATALDFPDALAGAAYAGHAGNVMLLVGVNATAASGAISAHKESVTSIAVLGGENAVSSTVVSELERALG